jgi:hypothetical protein
MLVNRIRVLVHSGSITPYIAELKPMKITNPFFKDNVVVHKELGFMAFKKLDLDIGMTKHNPSALYHEYVSFLKVTISDAHGLSSLEKLPMDLVLYFMDISAPVVDGDSAVYHATVMLDAVYADTCVAVHRIICIQVPICQDQRSLQILTAIGIRNMDALDTCLQHGLLPQFLPMGWQKKFPSMNCPF